MKRKHPTMSNGQAFPRCGGRSVFRLPYRPKHIIEITPAGTGMAREQEIGEAFPAVQVPAKSSTWRLTVYRQQTGRYFRSADDTENPIYLESLTPNKRAKALGLTAPQRRRYDSKRNKAQRTTDMQWRKPKAAAQ